MQNHADRLIWKGTATRFKNRMQYSAATSTLVFMDAKVSRDRTLSNSQMQRFTISYLWEMALHPIQLEIHGDPNSVPEA